MSEQKVPPTRLCKCGKTADVIKDYWVTESRIKNSVFDTDRFSVRSEYVCGIIRRRFCKHCLSKTAERQINFNRRLNIIILVSIFIPLALASGKYAFDAFISKTSGALIPFIAVTAFTVTVEALLFYKLHSSQKKLTKIKSGCLDDLGALNSLLDSLNFGLDEYQKLSSIPATDIVSDSEGRVNYQMERSGFSMTAEAKGRINIEPMSERLKHPFNETEEYVKKTYINAGLSEDNVKLPDNSFSKRKKAKSQN